MRTIDTAMVTDVVQALYGEAACVLPTGARRALDEALRQEESPLGRETLSQMLQNADIAAADYAPICQDTGMAVVFIDVGQEVSFVGMPLAEAVDKGVRRAVQTFGLRASVLDPLARKNTGDNTPAVLHLRMVLGDQVHITIAPKGFGSENMSRLFMLNPSDGADGVMDAVVRAVREAGGNPCPPVVVGVGVGGTAEGCLLEAKRALLRTVGAPSADEQLATMEQACLARINALGIGPMGLGGRTTALAVHMRKTPTHIAALPVGINLQCHCARHASRTL